LRAASEGYVPGVVRDPWLDNAKMALVTLVVLGHAWTLLPQVGVDEVLYDALYAWHVPAFVFVTGYLSRSFAYTPARMWQLVRTVVVPYLIFECLLALFRVYVGGENLERLFQNPHWPMWYLAALFFWRLLTPLFRAFPAVPAVGVAVVTSLVAGVWAGDTFDAARVLGLLPFFVLGLHATPERVAAVFAAGRRRWAALALVAVGVLAIWTDRLAATEWLYYRARYAELDVSDTRALLTRAGVMVVGAVGAWAFLTLVPRAAGWFTRMGAFTLVVYLVHGFFVLGAEYAGLPGWANDHPVLGFVTVSAAALGLALLLAWDPLASRLQHLVDPFGLAEHEVRRAVDVTVAQEVVGVGRHFDEAANLPDMAGTQEGRR
jgi:fucose 4-O-acetylase-like acetyltransferase